MSSTNQDSVATSSALACGSEEVCTDPKCQNMIKSLKAELAEQKGRMDEQDRRISELAQLLVNCKCKKPTSSTSHPLRECRICRLLLDCGIHNNVLSCKSCSVSIFIWKLEFFRINTKKGGVSKQCRYQHGACADLKPGEIRECTSCRWVKCVNEGMIMEDVGERGTKRPAAEDLDIGTVKLHPGSSQEKP
uniref:Nuclear receptor domain-containing protein n=1 Tax=Meloidogyne floridensis TaxID=298350 RepID=A0A915NQD6_9BILA